MFRGLFALVPLIAAAQSDALVLSERKPIAFILSTPSGAPGATTSSDIIRFISDRLEKHTSLLLREIDAVQVADCKGRVACLVTKLGGGSGRKETPSLMLAIAKLTKAGAPDRLSAILVDTERALQAAAEASAGKGEDWETEVEARIYESAVLVQPRWVAVEDGAATERFFERLFMDELRGPLESRGLWEPYGEILIEGAEPGMAIEIDGAGVGSTRPGSTRIAAVSPGKRALKLSGAKFQPYETEVLVERGRTQPVKAVLEPAATVAPALRKALFWTGAGVAAAGLAITAVAFARQNGDVASFCVAPGDGSCKSARAFASIGYDPGAAPTLDDKVNPGGVLLAPLGYSLFGAGATWALSTLLLDRPQDPPWIELGLGVLVGVAAYGASAILNGKSAFPR